MRIAIGNDHIVTAVKMQISDFLKANGHEVIDVGTHDNTPVSYTHLTLPTTERV